MKLFLLSFSIICTILVNGQEDTSFVRPTCSITSTATSPKIDGELDELLWENAKVYSNFKQAYPNYSEAPTFQTEVRLLYDNTAIYIYAKMLDDHPDSISMQLGTRDDNLNTDEFRMVFDTYNTLQDAFNFSVTASGVQRDSRFSDWSYNAVWESFTKKVEDGWVAEIKIPYSALRFPKKEIQTWGVQFTRNIFRTGEFDQWALVEQGAQNAIKYWGVLTGLENIQPPLRLSLQPFVTGITNEVDKGEYASSVVGGMDLKYGLNQSYTLDVSLLPDFSQVQNDNLVVNLGAFEQIYDEQRPFFQENIDLFQRGDLFYSRRIGRQPGGYYDIYDELEEGENLLANPGSAKLINIAKVSGRSSDGMGVGILNAVLDNTYAIIEDSLGETREVVTEPFSNYNIVVFDKQFNNSSNVYAINTNVYRAKSGDLANVSGIGGGWNNDENTWTAWGNTAVTNVMYYDEVKSKYDPNYGYSYDVGFGKSSGKFNFYLMRETYSAGFDNNHMGYTREVNYNENSLDLSYNHFKPFGRVMRARVGMGIAHQDNFTTKAFNFLRFSLNGNVTFKTFRNINYYFMCNPWGQIDYYEPRENGRVFFKTPNYYNNISFRSDSRKEFSYTVRLSGGTTAKVTESIGYNPFGGLSLNGFWRATNKLTVDTGVSFFRDYKDRGYVGVEELDSVNYNIVFGVRDMENVSYDFGIKYLFKNNLSLNINGRHYWVRTDYLSYHNLDNDGMLLDDTAYDEDHDFTFNAINIETLVQWQFAPGSFASLSWKVNGFSSKEFIMDSYSSNINNVFSESAYNQFSVKVLYYFDFLYLKKKNKVNQA